MTEVKEEHYSCGNIWRISYGINGKYHREDGPACICYYKDGSIQFKEYWINGKRHREDGPAYIGYHPNGNIEYKYYYIYGTHLNENEWYKQLSLKNKIKLAFNEY